LQWFLIDSYVILLKGIDLLQWIHTRTLTNVQVCRVPQKDAGTDTIVFYTIKKLRATGRGIKYQRTTSLEVRCVKVS